MKIEDVKKLFPENWEKPKNPVGYCYVTYCVDTGEFYIGKKMSPRFIDTYYGSGTVVKQWKSLKYELVHWVIHWAATDSELLEQEYKAVGEARNFVRDCVNLLPGGSPAMLGRKHSPETLQKMKESAKKIQHKPLSQETKDRISASNIGKHSKTAEERKAVGDFHRGRKRPEETCKKIGDSKRGANNPNFGKPRDEETKKKISEAQKGRKFTPEHREKLRQARQNYLAKIRGGHDNGKK